jgi:hypothetical protein
MTENIVLYEEYPRECIVYRLSKENKNYREDNNPWKVEVTFGDSGYEREPGIQNESIDKAIEKVTSALEDLIEIKHRLIKFRQEENVKHRQNSQ